MSQKIPCPHCSAPDWQKVTVEGEDRQTMELRILSF